MNSSELIIHYKENEIASGQHPWNAVIIATEHRLRPILLTAAAAILGMIPIAPTVFWGPMAYAIMGGLAVATLLTLVFLPALYVAGFRIRMPQLEAGSEQEPMPASDEQRPAGVGSMPSIPDRVADGHRCARWAAVLVPLGSC